MSHDVKDAELQTDSAEIFQSLLEALVSELRNFNADNSCDLVDILKGLREVYESAPNEASKREFADLLAKDMPAGACSVIYGFISGVFSELGKGVAGAVGHSMLLLHHYLMSWTSVSKRLCSKLVNDGHLLQHFSEIKELSNSLADDQFPRHLLLINIGIIYNCKEENLKYYSLNTKCMSALVPFLACTQWELQFHCRVILCSVIHAGGDIDVGLTKLSEEELKTLFQLLETVAHSADQSVSIQNCSFTAVELLSCVNLLLVNDDNVSAFRNNSTFKSTILCFLTSVKDTIEITLQILWKLLLPDPQDIHGDYRSSIVDRVSELLKVSNESSVHVLSECVLYVLTNENSKDISSQLKYAIGCYQFGLFRHCYELSSALLAGGTQTDEVINQALLLNGKSSFHLYQLEKNIPKYLLAKEYHQRHSSCYAKTREAILALGKALDVNSIDQEGSKMLDIAMMDYILATNNLKDLKRCLLCRRRVKTLIRSHFCPKSLLSAYAKGVMLPQNQRVIDTKLSEIGQTKSPKEVTYFMYCPECEDIFSKYGETQFMPEFFRVIYDVENPAQTGDRVVHYKEWLHQFCVGVIFRGISLMSNREIVFNEDELYRIFTLCRKYLLDLKTDNLLTCELPDVYILINPSAPRLQDKGFVFMNQILQNVFCMYGIGKYDLGTGHDSFPHRAHYFFFHTGIINIILKLSPSQNTSLPDAYLICREGGDYCIPEDNKRADIIPVGMWKLFQISSVNFYECWLQRSSKTKVTGPMIMPDEKLKMVYGMVNAVEKDLETTSNVINPVPNATQPLVVNLLPKEIVFVPNSLLKLPEGHKILLHLHFDLKDGDGEIVFLATSFTKEYPKQPYVIYQFYSPKMVMIAGFFINVHDMTAGEFLPSSDGPKMILDKLQNLANVRKLMPTVIPLMLKERGFASLHSLLYRASSPERSPASVDLKCSTVQRCWYCSNLCEICLKDAVYGLTVHHRNGMMLKFCSKQCQQQHRSPTTLPMLVKVFSPNQVPSNFMSYSRKIQESHTEVLFIQGYRSDPSGNHVKVDIALCSGDGSKHFSKSCMYVAYYHRSAFSQQFVEYFVSKDMMPLEMLPYYGKSSLHDIMGKSLSENIRIFITKAIVAHNLPLDVVLSNLSIEDEDCSINKEQISSLVSSDDPNSTSPSEEDPIIKMFQSTCTQMKTSDSDIVSGVVLKNVFDALMDVRGLLMKALPQLRSAVADSIVNLIEPVKTFHTFLEGLFQAIVDGRATEELVQCFQLQQCLLMGFTDSSERFCDMLLYHGLICHQIDQVLALRQSDPNPFIDLLLSLAVGIIYNCRMSKLFFVYFEDKDCSFFVKPYLNSSNFIIAFQCKTILAAFSQQLSEARHMLTLNDLEVDKILKLIGDALHSPELLTSCEQSSFSALELLMSLIALLINADNRLLLCSKAGFIPIIVTALSSGNVGVETAGCLLLWNMLELFSDPSVSAKPSSKMLKKKKEYLLEQEKDVITKKHAAHFEFIKSLKDSELCGVLNGILEVKADSEDDFGVLCKCTLWTLRGIDFSDDRQVLMCMEQCCKYGKNQSCLNCYRITFEKAALSNAVNKAKYLAGKSCFYMYREKQRQLQFTSLSPADMHQYRNSFCALMFEAVKFLGVSVDQGLLIEDDKWMLDRAMIDYVHATNNLKDCMRCLLCLKKSRDIRRSHYCPRKILERFASGCYMPNNMKAVLSLHEGNVVSCDTPKTETLYMFCSSCEDLLSQNGETQFLPMFFDKLYDVADLKETSTSGPVTTVNNNPSQHSLKDDATPSFVDNTSGNIAADSLASVNPDPTVKLGTSSASISTSVASSEAHHLSQSKNIVYDRWLYLFCVGVVFRGIAYISRKSYVNSNELYDLFVKCRECLLKAPHIDDVANLPIVEILISPSSPNVGDEKHGFIHLAMRMLYQFTIGITDLQNGTFSFPQKAHFVLAQVGIINILGKLSPSRDIPAPPGCVIGSSEGVQVYHVPASEERYSLCYQGIWEVIHSTAQELMEAWWQRPKQFCPQETHGPSDDVMDLYNIEGSGFTDLHALDGKILAAQPSSLQPTTLDFLPDGFHLDSSLHTVRFPDGHRIVSHKCFYEEPIKSVYFIAIGQTGAYNANKPYTVVHFSAPGLVIKVGFFIDIKELVALDFLPDRNTREMLQDIKVIEKIRNELHTNLFLILQEKGFCSLILLLEYHSRFIVDTKCAATTVCWYCQDLCERCLKPATHTFNTFHEQNTYNFCCVDCKDSFFVNQGESSFKFDSSSSDDFIQLEGQIFRLNELPTFVNVKISTDDNFLVFYYERSLKSQLCFQILCNKMFDILNPVLNDDWLASEGDLKDKQISMLHNMVDKLKISRILTIVHQKLLAANNDLIQKLKIS